MRRSDSYGWVLLGVLLLSLSAFVGCAEEEEADPEAAFEEAVLFDEEAPEIFELAHTGTQVVYVNFDGPRIDDCENYCSDAINNQSWAIDETWESDHVDFLPYEGSQSDKDEIVRRLREGFEDYNIEFTTSRPSAGPYTMLVISPTTGPHHGVAPLNCENRNPSDIAFVYRIGNSSLRWISQAGAHELGHSFGLSHVVNNQDFMQWASSGNLFTSSLYDEDHPSGKCFDGDTQDAPAMLTRILGARLPDPPWFEGTFADDEGNMHEAAIEALVAAGVTQGCAGGAEPQFCPAQTVTRGQMVTFLMRALSLTPSGKDYFSDDNGAWYEGAANAAADAGITLGCGDGRFCGEEKVTREQMATFLARAFNYPAPTQDFFSDDESSPHQDDINRIAEAGVTLGCGDGKYCPDNLVRRDEMASFLSRAMGLL